MVEEMPLDELREARELTQEQLDVSKMERRTDMYLSTLQGIIKAMGGRLEIRAVFRMALCASISFRICGSARRSGVTGQKPHT